MASLNFSRVSVRIRFNLFLLAVWLLSLDFWHVLSVDEISVAKELSKLWVILDRQLDVIWIDPSLLVSFSFSCSKLDDLEN